MADKKDYIIIGLLLLVVFLLGMMAGRGNSDQLPFAYADGSANGIVVTTGAYGDNDRLYLIDTDKKVICVYDNFKGGKFRVCGIHSYRYDVEFSTSSGDRKIEDNSDGADFMYMKKKFEK